MLEQGMYKEIGYWLRKEFATNLGGHVIPLWTMAPVAEFVAKQTAKYGYDMMDEDSSYPGHIAEGATHVIRCITGYTGLVDGVDIFIRVAGGGFDQISEVDGPDLQGAEYDEAQAWLLEIGVPLDA